MAVVPPPVEVPSPRLVDDTEVVDAVVELAEVPVLEPVEPDELTEVLEVDTMLVVVVVAAAVVVVVEGSDTDVVPGTLVPLVVVVDIETPIGDVGVVTGTLVEVVVVVVTPLIPVQ